MYEGKPTGAGFVYRIECPKRCGWYRDYSNESDKLYKKVTHPLYGELTQETLVQLDVQNHDCTSHFNARLRLNRRRFENGRG